MLSDYTPEQYFMQRNNVMQDNKWTYENNQWELAKKDEAPRAFIRQHDDFWYGAINVGHGTIEKKGYLPEVVTVCESLADAK